MFKMDGIIVVDKIVEDCICVVVMLIVFLQCDFIKCVKEVGVMVYVVKFFDVLDVILVIEIVMVCFVEICGVEDEVMDLEECFELCKIVDQVKGILQISFDFIELEVFWWIQKIVMDLCKLM